MFKATIDRPKLEKSLKRFASDFGETSAQAVVRWSVQTCRELAFETQAWGRSATKSKQQNAILRDAYNVLFVARSIKPRAWKKGSGFLVVMEQGKNPFNVEMERVLMSESEVNMWIDSQRKRRGKRTRRLPAVDRKFCDKQTFRKAMHQRFNAVGEAKGGWLGAGQEIAKAQTGQEKIEIGKTYFPYAQKHAHFGSAKKPTSGWRPSSSLTNSVPHVSTNYVLETFDTTKAINWALKKTITWYSKAMKRIDDKKP